jgi:hypothetical protein
MTEMIVFSDSNFKGASESFIVRMPQQKDAV